jgi:hypothetical protein
MMTNWTAEQHGRYLRDCTTEHLLDTYRRWPTQAVQNELESRGLILWHYGLTTTKESTMTKPANETIYCANLGQEIYLHPTPAGTLELTADVGDEETTIELDRDAARRLRPALQRFEAAIS